MILATYVLDKERKKAAAEGMAKGKVQGRNTAYQRANIEFAAYHQRMRAAQEAGEPFNEPPPYFPLEYEI